MTNRKYVIFDFETDSKSANEASPIQFGAVAIDSLKLEVIPNSEFYSWSCPNDIDDPNYYEKHKDTIDWHCKPERYNCKPEDFVERLKKAPEEKVVFENFVKYLSQYHIRPTGQSIFTAPILAGYNSYSFDFPILDRLCGLYKRTNKTGEQNIYLSRDAIDIMKIVTLWFAPLSDIDSYTMDSLRDYMGMAKAGAHDARVDVLQEAQILIKFLKLHKDLSTRIKFKGAFASV